jgi:GTPase involved in cell partitioning and DNA repair
MICFLYYKSIYYTKVPVGITISNDAGQVVYDLDKVGTKVMVAQGGQGGGPTNNWFGLKGQFKYLRLDLKLIADIGLVGFPNAGKSTLLKVFMKTE